MFCILYFQLINLFCYFATFIFQQRKYIKSSTLKNQISGYEAS